MIVRNSKIWDISAEIGYRSVRKLPQKLITLEHLLLSLFVLKRKEFSPFAALQLFRVECLLFQCAQVINFRQGCRNWLTNSISVPKELKWNEYKNKFQNTNRTHNTALNKISDKVFFKDFDKLGFQVQSENKRFAVTVHRLNTVHNGAFNYQPENLD